MASNQSVIKGGPSQFDLSTSLGHGCYLDEYYSRADERVSIEFRIKNGGRVRCVIDMLEREGESNKRWFFKGRETPMSREGHRRKIKGFYSLHDRTGWIEWLDE